MTRTQKETQIIRQIESAKRAQRQATTRAQMVRAMNRQQDAEKALQHFHHSR